MRSPFLLSDPRCSREAPTPEITVGPDTGNAPVSSHFALQGALDAAARLGGGTVRILPGRYVLRNALFLPSGVTLMGNDVTLEKHPSATSKLVEDLDWYGWQARVEDAALFAVGDGIVLESQRIDGGRTPQVSRHTIVRIEGNILHLDSPPRLNHWTNHGARATSIHSLVEAQRASEITIRDLTIIGNRESAAYLDGNYGGAIFFQDCEDLRIEGVTIRDFNGDAVSWQVSHDVKVENCTIDGASMLGFHPGSGSQRPAMRGNTIRNCETGIYWCWGVRNGVAEDNRISGCAKHGISTGHRDTDNIIRRNHISQCGEAAIFFRTERSPAHTSHRTVIEGNFITCPETPAGSLGISVARGVEDVVVRANAIRVPPGGRAHALVIDPTAIRPDIAANTITDDADRNLVR